MAEATRAELREAMRQIRISAMRAAERVANVSHEKSAGSERSPAFVVGYCGAAFATILRLTDECGISEFREDAR